LYSIFAVIFWETRRSDFVVSMTHHVTSLTLIVVSYLANLARFGSMVMAVHDGSDVFLEIGKLTKYSGLVVVPSISFVLFAISWLILRLLIFPFVLVRSASCESPQYFSKLVVGGTTYYYVFNTLLITLQVMHIYWWVLIWRQLMEQIQDRGKVSDDVRSDSDLDPDLEPNNDSDWESDFDDESKDKRD
jgi:hypothetical protein